MFAASGARAAARAQQQQRRAGIAAGRPACLWLSRMPVEGDRRAPWQCRCGSRDRASSADSSCRSGTPFASPDACSALSWAVWLQPGCRHRAASWAGRAACCCKPHCKPGRQHAWTTAAAAMLVKGDVSAGGAAALDTGDAWSATCRSWQAWRSNLACWVVKACMAATAAATAARPDQRPQDTGRGPTWRMQPQSACPGACAARPLQRRSRRYGACPPRTALPSGCPWDSRCRHE